MENLERISIRIPKMLLDDFDEYAKSKGYQRRQTAIIDLIKSVSNNF